MPAAERSHISAGSRSSNAAPVTHTIARSSARACTIIATMDTLTNARSETYTPAEVGAAGLARPATDHVITARVRSASTPGTHGVAPARAVATLATDVRTGPAATSSPRVRARFPGTPP